MVFIRIEEISEESLVSRYDFITDKIQSGRKGLLTKNDFLSVFQSKHHLKNHKTSMIVVHL